MDNEIRLVATDIDGTFVRHRDYGYDVERFERLLARMRERGIEFVVASGNQYWQLRDLFPGHDADISYVAENGAYIVDHGEPAFIAQMSDEARVAGIDACLSDPAITTIMCGVKSAYCQRGTVTQEFFDFSGRWYHRLQWVDDFRDVDDQVIKFAPSVPEERTWEFYDRFCERLGDLLTPTTSGHGGIDLIVPGCHKAWGLGFLAERWGVAPEACVAFGDNMNDVEMLRWCGRSFAVEAATRQPSDGLQAMCPDQRPCPFVMQNPHRKRSSAVMIAWMSPV